MEGYAITFHLGACSSLSVAHMEACMHGILCSPVQPQHDLRQ